MVNSLNFYYFSPTGGTKKCGEIFCRELCGNISPIDLCAGPTAEASAADLAVIALPVFAGRLPTPAAQRLKELDGAGMPAVTLAVYGNRAYEDALLELNDIARQCSFRVVASAAMIAQHSVVPELANGRPDSRDAASIAEFARRVAEKLERGDGSAPAVPGSSPYKSGHANPASPISGEGCSLCALCASVCPVNAVALKGGRVETDAEKCFLCMACVSKCPAKARALPAPVQEKMNAMLARYIPIRRENEYFH